MVRFSNTAVSLTHAILDVLCTANAGRDVLMRKMKEVEDVAKELGSEMRLPVERRVDGAARAGKHKTSVSPDVESGREMEIDTVIGSVVELAKIYGENTPCIHTIFGTI